MSTNVTLISNTLVNKYLAYDGGDVAVHDFPTQNAGEFLMKLLFTLLSLTTRQEREGEVIYVISKATSIYEVDVLMSHS